MIIRNSILALLTLLICFGWAINNIENHNIKSDTENLKPQAVDSLAVEGIIIDEIPGYCGIYCLGGMIKVKLDKNFSFNGIDTIYIITACATKNGYKGNRINVKATRLLDTDTECYYRNYNRLDNHIGLTFKLSELESGRI